MITRIMRIATIMVIMRIAICFLLGKHLYLYLFITKWIQFLGPSGFSNDNGDLNAERSSINQKGQNIERYFSTIQKKVSSFAIKPKQRNWEIVLQ